MLAVVAGFSSGRVCGANLLRSDWAGRELHLVDRDADASNSNLYWRVPNAVLKDEGKIIEGEGWQKVRETPLQTGKVTVQKRNGQEKRIGGNLAKFTNELYCPSYFARDGLSKLFV